MKTHKLNQNETRQHSDCKTVRTTYRNFGHNNLSMHLHFVTCLYVLQQTKTSAMFHKHATTANKFLTL